VVAAPRFLRSNSNSHASPVASDTHAQQWFLRLDQADVEAVQYAVKLGSWVRSGVKWALRAFWFFTAGLTAALTIGENLQKLPGMISGTLSALRGLFGG